MPLVHGDGQRFAPEVGQEAPIAEQCARLHFVATRLRLHRTRVLDCGSGTGYSLDFLAARSPTALYLGIDQEQEAVDYARGRYPHLPFVVMNGLRLGFPPDSFDVVLSFEVLEHLVAAQQSTYIQEIHRVLKPGGTLVLSTPNKDVFSLGHRDSLNKFHLKELTLGELEALLVRQFRSVDILGQYFHSEHVRTRDVAFLRRKYSLTRRCRLAFGRTMRNNAVLGGLWRALETIKDRRSLGRRVYPWMISPEDFAFDQAHLRVAKWFLCLCTK